MASHRDEELARVIQRYGEVADMVNHREMKRFIQEIRQRWNPLPHEEDWRYEGWTDEGAFTRCIYTRAFYISALPEPDLNRPDITQAEEEGQVQFHPTLDEIMDYVDKPLAEPRPQSEITEMLNRQREAIQQQLRAAGFSATQASEAKLPADIGMLFSITNGINGAGVPSETAYTSLVYPDFGQNYGDGYFGSREMPDVVRIRAKSHQQGRGEMPIAAWQFGGCTQHRSVYYVLSLPDGKTELSSAKWKIWDLIDVEVNIYENLTEWLVHETEYVENESGGAAQELVVTYDRYPV